jgi:hypothetical protein
MPLSPAPERWTVKPARTTPDPLQEFPAEVRTSPRRLTAAWPAVSALRMPLRTRVGIGLALAGIVVIVAAPMYLPDLVWPDGPAPVIVTDSTVTLSSTPAGAGVYINDALVGKTPISLRLPVGIHSAELRSGVMSRKAALTVEAGRLLSEHVDFTAASTTGGLEITTEPAGARVSVDGKPRGVTPLRIDQIEPGTHRITVSSGQTAINRTVEVAAGATATVLVSVPSVPPTGSVAINAPVEVQVFEGGRLLGTGTALRINLPPGRRTLELISQPLGFRTESVVEVAAGRSTTMNVPMPTGSLSINALPWAEVWVDGRTVGQTPIGNLSVSLGTHEIVWKHPEHGERRQLVLVSATEPVRIGIDWSR